MAMSELGVPVDSHWSSLIERARTGGPGSLNAICQRVRSFLQGQCRGRLRSRLRSKVGESDIVQDALVSISQNFAAFRGQTADEFLAWVIKILKNKTRTIERRFRCRRRDISLEAEAGTDGMVVRQIPDPKAGAYPADRLASGEDVVYLQQLVAELKEEYRQVIRLRLVEDLTFPQIAARMDSTEPAVKQLYVRAIRKISSQIRMR